MTTPSVSVVMPVYNASQYLAEAIESILVQTFSDFELIVVNDGSTDDSLRIINSFKDTRLKILENKTNMGNYATRNKGDRAARGKYICVMDSDDVACPDRLEKQYSFMEHSPGVGMAGSCIQYIGSKQPIFRDQDYEITKIKLLSNNYICHPSVIMRRELLMKYNLWYDESFWYAGDYDLMVRASSHFPVINMGEVLLHYRWSAQQLSASMNKYGHETNRIRLKQLTLLGINPTAEEQQIHLSLLSGVQLDYSMKNMALQWFRKILDANSRVSYYNQDYLNDFLEGILNNQLFFSGNDSTKPAIKNNTIQNKIDLTDVTFVIPVRVDSEERKANIETLLRIIEKEFKTHIIVLEAGKAQIITTESDNVEYHFIYDDDPVFHRTKYINRLIGLATTPIVAVWDCDSIGITRQISDAVNQIRQKNATMAFPYDGRHYTVDKIMSKLFRQTMRYEVLTKKISVMQLKNGFYAKGGAFVVNQEEYLKAGGENENLCGSAFVNEERVKRMEISGKTIYLANGPMFHLWHPGKGRFAGKKNEMNNIREFLKTCNKNIYYNAELSQSI